MATREEHDLIVVGSGIGGLAAAITAADSGLRVLLLERGPRLGGTAAWSYGIVWVGANHLARNLGCADTIQDTAAYLHYLGGGRNDRCVTLSFIQNSPKALLYFAQSANVPFYVIEKLPDHYFPVGDGSKSGGRSIQVKPFEAKSLGDWREKLETTPFNHGRITFEEMAAWGGRAGYRNWDLSVLRARELADIRTFGPALAGYFLKAAVERPISIRTDADVSRLLVKDRRVQGVEILQDGRTKKISSTCGVVLATGAYDANPDLMTCFDEFSSFPPGGKSENRGDGLVMALELGAGFIVSHGSLSLKLSYHVEGEKMDGHLWARGAGPRELSYPHSILVNRSGRRFADESSFGDISARLRHFDPRSHRLLNVPLFLIFDSQYLEKYGLPPQPPGSPPPEGLPRADTIEELARTLKVDSAVLSGTVERFNGFVAKGRDEDFARGEMPWSRQAASDLALVNPNLGALTKPPFFGLRVLPSQGNAVGLKTNSVGQVMHLRGYPISGLYACGDVASWRHIGVGYQAGLSLAGGMTFGWLAAQHAAASKGQPPANTT
jgi:3-oxosteroid 1-dehydrogenase